MKLGEADGPAHLAATAAEPLLAGATAHFHKPASVVSASGAMCSWRVSRLMMLLWVVTACGSPREQVLIPGASFLMGCNSDLELICSSQSASNEVPRHEVVLTPFDIDKYEVTVGEYLQCFRTGRCEVFTPDMQQRCNFELTSDSRSAQAIAGREEHPINCITAGQAGAYCEWEGKRLPTEAEWELAARGAEARIYPWGNDATPTCDRSVLASAECPAPGTKSILGRPSGASPYGAHDMAGNVFEWVSDAFDAFYYSKSPREAPQGPGEGSTHVMRGGSWRYGPMGDEASYERTIEVFRTSHRNALIALEPSSARRDDVGFRCVHQH